VCVFTPLKIPMLAKIMVLQLQVTPECLVSWRVFGEPSDVSKDNVPATRDEVQYWAEAGE